MHLSYVQVDLFFYREPEEAKQPEEEELAAPIEYGSAVAPDYAMNLDSQQWPTQISDAQWPGEVQNPIAAVPGVSYFPEGQSL